MLLLNLSSKGKWSVSGARKQVLAGRKIWREKTVFVYNSGTPTSDQLVVSSVKEGGGRRTGGGPQDQPI